MNIKTTNQTDVKFNLTESIINLTIHLESLNNFHIELLDIVGNKLFLKTYKERDYVAERIDLTSIKPGLLYFKVIIGDEPVIKELINHKENENYIM